MTNPDSFFIRHNTTFECVMQRRAMTTVRDLLELGFPEYAKKSLKENGGQVPLCCVFVSDVDKWSCLWLLKKRRRILKF